MEVLKKIYKKRKENDGDVRNKEERKGKERHRRL